MKQQYIALITGAGRELGIGYQSALQLAREGYTVIITGRNIVTLTELADKAGKQQLDIIPLTLDVNNHDSISQAVRFVEEKFGRLDVLINNAISPRYYGSEALINFKDAVAEDVRHIFETNIIGIFQLTKAMLPLLRKSSHARVVNVSSQQGKLSDMEYIQKSGGMSFYGMSKAALNAFTVKLAKDLAEDHIQVNAVTPGFTANHDFAVALGGRPVDDGARSITLAVMQPKEGPTGVWFKDGEIISW